MESIFKDCTNPPSRKEKVSFHFHADSIPFWSFLAQNKLELILKFLEATTLIRNWFNAFFVCWRDKYYFYLVWKSEANINCPNQAKYFSFLGSSGHFFNVPHILKRVGKWLSNWDSNPELTGVGWLPACRQKGCRWRNSERWPCHSCW